MVQPLVALRGDTCRKRSLKCRGRNAVVLGAKADHGRLDIPKLLSVALACLCVAGQRFENLQGDGPLDAANVGPGLFGPDDALSHCAGVVLPVAAPGPSSP